MTSSFKPIKLNHNTYPNLHASNAKSDNGFVFSSDLTDWQYSKVRLNNNQRSKKK